MVIQHSSEGSFLLHLCQIESSRRQDWRFLPKAQSSILNAPPLGYLAACSLPSSLWETKVYYYTWFSLVGLLHLLQALHWKISVHALVSALVLVPELIIGVRVCFAYKLLQGFSFLVHVSIINGIGLNGGEGFMGGKQTICRRSGVVCMLNTVCNLQPTSFVGFCQAWLGMRVNAGAGAGMRCFFF